MPGQPQPPARRNSPRTSWADLGDDSDDDSQSQSASVSQGFSSDNGCPAAGGLKLPGRKTKGAKLSNKSLSKNQLAASPNQLCKTSTGLSTDSANESSMDASSMSEDMSGTPRSGMGSTRSTQSASDSNEGSTTYQNAGWSVGSAKHDEDGCKPCLFVHTHVGCQNGSNCEFCHYIHKRKNKARPCKGKRERYRKLLLRMEEDALDSQAGSAIDNSSDAGSQSESLASHDLHDEICTIAQI